MPSRSKTALKEGRKSPPLPRGGGMASGVKGVDQEGGEEDEDGRKARAGNADGEDVSLEALTLGEFNRWLVTEHNWALAEECREQHVEGEQFRKARDDRHRERGQVRQQDTVEQMKEAKTRVDAHRRLNLEAGSAVKRDVIAWNAAAHEEAAAWAKYGQSIRESQKSGPNGPNSVKVVQEELTALKKEQGAEVRKEVEELKKECNTLREQHAHANKEKADEVRKQTADTIIDGSKKHFFLQRRAAAKETAGMVEKWTSQKKANRAEFLAAFKARAAKSASSRDASRSARQGLQAKRMEEAALMREQRATLTEQRQLNLTEQSMLVRETVNNTISERFVHPEASRRMITHPHYSEVSAVVTDVTSSVSREIASSPRRSRRPNSAPGPATPAIKGAAAPKS